MSEQRGDFETVRADVARWLAFMYGGEEYAEQTGSNGHWREMADELFRSVPALLAADTGEAQQAVEGYTVELGGQVYTQAQWEALQPYIEGRANAVSEDAATWSPS